MNIYKHLIEFTAILGFDDFHSVLSPDVLSVLNEHLTSLHKFMNSCQSM